MQNNPRVPVFSVTGTGIGDTAIGGYVPEYENGAEVIANQIRKYYDTDDIEDAHFHTSKSLYLFDSRKLKEWKIAEYALPKGSVIEDTMAAKLSKYSHYIELLVAGILLLVLLLFVTWLLLRMRRLKLTLEEREGQLVVAREKAEESDMLKSAFLANMSHEIRTPLNAIVGFSSILAETDEEQEKREYISIIENNNALLLQLIGDILDLSKIEAGTLEFNFSDFELNELMHEKENIIRMKTAEGVELIFEPGLDACLFHSDRNRLSQLLINLLTNAAKFTAKGSIRFGYRTEGSRLRFYVSDTGCGIPPEGQRRIFDRFVKLNDFVSGTGLGLQKHCRTSRRRDRCEVGRRARHDLLVHASLRHRQALRNPVRGDPDGFGRKGQTDDPHCRGQRQQLPSLRNDPAPRLPADTRPGRGAGRGTVPHGTSAPDSHGHQHARDERLRGRGGNPQIRGGNPDRRRHGLRLRLRRAEDHAERIHGLHAQADQRPAAQKTDSRHPAGTHHADMKR